MLNQSIQPTPQTSFEGIITSLNNNYQTTWNNYVSIKPHSTNNYQGRNGAQSLINRSVLGDEIGDNWCSDYKNNEYFILSFPKFFVASSYYSLQSKTKESIFPVSWKIEGSLNKKDWVLLDEKVDRNELLYNSATITFAFSNIVLVKHLKFTQTKPYDQNYPNFCLRQVEIFGSIYYSLHTCMNHSFLSTLVPFFLVLGLKH